MQRIVAKNPIRFAVPHLVLAVTVCWQVGCGGLDLDADEDAESQHDEVSSDDATAEEQSPPSMPAIHNGNNIARLPVAIEADSNVVSWFVSSTATNAEEFPSLQLGEARVQARLDNTNASHYIPVHNAGEATVCFVHGEPVRLLDGTMSAVAVSAVDYVIGAAAYVGVASTSSCIEAGGDAHIVGAVYDEDLISGSYTDVSTIEVTLQASGGDAHLLDYPVLATRFVLDNDRVHVDITNFGDEAAKVDQFVSFLGIDAQGYPTGTGTILTSSPLLLPGETATEDWPWVVNRPAEPIEFIEVYLSYVNPYW